MSQPHLQVHPADYTVPTEAAGWQKMYLVIGIVGLIACVAGYLMQPEQLLRGYLIGFMLWLGLSLRKAHRNADARQAFQKSMELNPRRIWAKEQLEKTPAS